MAFELWTRWTRVAHRAAQFQGQVLFFLLYFLVLVPVSLFQRTPPGFGRGSPASRPRWHVRPGHAPDLAGARRQF